MLNLLIDENLSPTLVQLLGEQKGVPAMHVAHTGMAGDSDLDLWRYAYERSQTVVTINASDFLRLAEGVDLHPGLIVFRVGGLTREEQWAWLEPAKDHCSTAVCGPSSWFQRIGSSSKDTKTH